MATIHYDVRIECRDAQELAEQLAAVQTVPGVFNVASDIDARVITFELQTETE